MRFVLSEEAVVSFSITRVRPGARGPAIARFSRPARAGVNSLRLTTQLTNRKLEPGDYRLTIVPRDPAGNRGKPVSAHFGIRASR